MRACPKCPGETALTTQTLLDKVEVDYCPACGGIYFDEGEVGAVLQLSKDIPNYKDLLAAAPASCPCPGCKATMKDVRYVPDKDLHVDLCEACGGVWMDRGEIREAKQVADAQEHTKLRLLRSVWDMRNAVKGDSLPCPNCKAATVHAFNTSEDVDLDMCDRCSGVWFEKGEIAKYMEMGQDNPDIQASLATATETDKGCPACKGSKLVEFDYAAIETPEGKLRVDYCKGCEGYWLDAGEILNLEYLSTQLESPGHRLGRAIKELHDDGYMIFGAA